VYGGAEARAATPYRLARSVNTDAPWRQYDEAYRDRGHALNADRGDG
jgi:hypothetical protein